MYKKNHHKMVYSYVKIPGKDRDLKINLILLNLEFKASIPRMQIRRLKAIRWEVICLLFIISALQIVHRKYEIILEKPNSMQILNKYIQPPDKRKYNLSSVPANYEMDKLEFGRGARTYIQLLFSDLFKKMDGFYIEAGALDGEYLSNTLFLEYFQNWKGLLIEPDPNNYQSLLQKHRKAWTSNTCLSTTGNIHNISLVTVVSSNNQNLSQTDNMMLHAQSYNAHYENKYDTMLNHTDKSIFVKESVSALCFPMEAYLEALGVTTVDLLSLDIQGGEYDVLNTIPWEKFIFKLIVVEIMDEDLNEDLLMFMKSKSFSFINVFAEDYIFYNASDAEMHARVQMINVVIPEDTDSALFSFNNEAIRKYS
ncbi:unnamed protein product, partial [Meganyctiphanes norvegica]